MNRISVPNRVFFYTAGFTTDLFNYVALMAEVLMAHRLFHATELNWAFSGPSSFPGLHHSVASSPACSPNASAGAPMLLIGRPAADRVPGDPPRHLLYPTVHDQHLPACHDCSIGLP